MKHKLKFDKHLLWLRPYTEAIADLVDITKLREVKLSLYRGDRPPSLHGSCEQVSKRHYKIIVRTYDKSDKRWPMCKTSQEQLLINYAHECSHLKIFEDYVAERFLLEAQIYLRFAEILKTRGYEQDVNKL